MADDIKIDPIFEEEVSEETPTVQPDKTDVKQKPDHLFKPGQSGNPAGRPKGTKNLTTLLVDALKGNTKNGKTWEQNLIDRVIEQAVIKGDMRAIEHIWDRTEGKPEQGHIMTGNLTISFDSSFGETIKED